MNHPPEIVTYGSAVREYAIVPGLVSVKTDVSGIPDFLMSADLNFYRHADPKSESVYSFAYGFTFPQDVRYRRIGNYYVSRDSIRYYRPVAGRFGFIFDYHYGSHRFLFHNIYRYHHVNIGDIFTAGRHVFHRIEADLVLRKKFVILSAAVRFRGKTVVVLAPNTSGKTTFVTRLLLRGASYISENFSVVDIKAGTVYGTAPVFRNKSRISNAELGSIFAGGNISVVPYANIDEIYLIVPKDWMAKSNEVIIRNYVQSYSGYFKKNNFVRSGFYDTLQYHKISRLYAELAGFMLKRVRIIDSFNRISV